MTVRIDTLRTRLTAATQLLHLLHTHIDDIHTLAYNRPAARQRQRVAGGQPDHALDTHGDPQARQLLHDIGDQLITLIDDTTLAAHNAITYLRTGHTSRRRDTTADATADEIATALAALRRRKARGEATPTLERQPTRHGATNHQAELDALTSALRKMHPRERPDRGRLTPLEQAAWRRALGLPDPGRRRKKR